MTSAAQIKGFGFFLGAALMTVAGHADVVKVDPPTELTPMTVSAALTQAGARPGETVMVTIAVRLLPGWHTYAVVPPEEPYIQTKWILEPGAGVTAEGDWLAPPATPDPENPKLMLYQSQKDPLVFLHDLRVADDAKGEITVRAGVLFQTCDASRCLPPERKVFDLKLKVAPASP